MGEHYPSALCGNEGQSLEEVNLVYFLIVERVGCPILVNRFAFYVWDVHSTKFTCKIVSMPVASFLRNSSAKLAFHESGLLHNSCLHLCST